MTKRKQLVTYEERTGMLSRNFEDGTTLNFLFSDFGLVVQQKSIPFFKFFEMLDYGENAFIGSIYLDGEIETIVLSIDDYDNKWGGYKVTLSTCYGNKTKLIKKHDIATLSCLVSDYSRMIREGRKEQYRKVA